MLESFAVVAEAMGVYFMIMMSLAIFLHALVDLAKINLKKKRNKTQQLDPP